MTVPAAPRRTGVRWFRLGIAGALIGALLATSTSASAHWSTTAEHIGSSTAAVTLSAPSTISCLNQSIILVSVARVSWPAVTGATGYHVVVTRASDGTSFTRDQTGASIDLSTGLLGDLLTGLLAPTTLTVRVYPAVDYGGGAWISSSSRAHTASAAVLPIGTTCGSVVT